jgi:hypothetical protein
MPATGVLLPLDSGLSRLWACQYKETAASSAVSTTKWFSRAGCVVEALSEGDRIIFTELMEIRILGKMEKPPGINVRPGRLVHSAKEAGAWQTQQDENEARIRR